MLPLETTVRLRPPRLVALLAHLAAPLALGLPVAAVVPVLATAHLGSDENLKGIIISFILRDTFVRDNQTK